MPMSAGEAEREAMMARMKAAGLGGQMYNRCGCWCSVILSLVYSVAGFS